MPSDVDVVFTPTVNGSDTSFLPRGVTSPPSLIPAPPTAPHGLSSMIDDDSPMQHERNLFAVPTASYDDSLSGEEGEEFSLSAPPLGASSNKKRSVVTATQHSQGMDRPPVPSFHTHRAKKKVVLEGSGQGSFLSPPPPIRTPETF